MTSTAGISDCDVSGEEAGGRKVGVALVGGLCTLGDEGAE